MVGPTPYVDVVVPHRHDKEHMGDTYEPNEDEDLCYINMVVPRKVRRSHMVEHCRCGQPYCDSEMSCK